MYGETSVDLVAVFFLYLSSINNEGFRFFDYSEVLIYMMVFLFSIPFESILHARTFIPRQNPLVSIWFRMILTQIITRVHKDSLT